jgi:hypothetical protein
MRLIALLILLEHIEPIMAVNDSYDYLEILKSFAFPLFIFLFLLQILRNKYGHSQLRHIPGPALAAYTGLWRANDARKGQSHKTMIDLHRKHGNLVRTAPNVVSIADANMIPLIYNLKGDYAKVGERGHLFSNGADVFTRPRSIHSKA